VKALVNECDWHELLDRRYRIQTWSPNGGNPTPIRQGRFSEKNLSARKRLVEVVGGCASRTQVNRRKAFPADKLVRGSEVQNPFLAGGVLTAGCIIKSIVLTQGSPMGSYKQIGSLRNAKTENDDP